MADPTDTSAQPITSRAPSDSSDYKVLADYLKFAREQIEQDRKDFNHKFDWTMKFLAFLLVAVGLPIGFIGFKSLDELMAELRNTTKAETDAAKVQREAMRDSLQTTLASIQQAVQNQRDTLQGSFDATKGQLKVATQNELDNVRDAVNKRVAAEFMSDNIEAVVRSVAAERTQKELNGIIHSETSILVAKGIQEAQPSIQRTVENQTKEAVRAMEPTISGLVKTATDEQVSRSVAPIQNQMKVYADFIRMGNLTILARGDDRTAFDYLVQVSLGNKPESTSSELKGLADATASAVIAENTTGLHLSREFKKTQTPEAMKKFMTSTSPQEREAALDHYPENDNTILPMLVQLIRNEPTVTVLNKAVRRFNVLTKQTFDFWRERDILDWWDKNQDSFK